MMRWALMVAGALALSGCQTDGRSTRHLAPIPPAASALMTSQGVTPSDPILMRSFKKEAEIEVWKRGSDGRYAHFKTYPMCRWSGQLGPKLREGDRQAPEGFYDVTPASMNPNSSLYLSFNLGFPNAFDRSLNRTGSLLMVHGSCSSQGCFAMTDEAISEVYAIAREAFAGGQRSFQFQSFPFRLTAENLAKHRADPNIAFWMNLKEGADRFEVTNRETTWTVGAGRYEFGDGAAEDSPEIASTLETKRRRDAAAVADLVAKGTPAIRLVYQDGSGHASFREIAVATPEGGLFGSNRQPLGEVSRPDALLAEPAEIRLMSEPRATGSTVPKRRPPDPTTR